MADVRAEISANVRRVRAEAGRSVAVGDELVVLEAMQTEIPVLAPVGGTVTEVLVVPDTRVEEGDVVAVIEAATPPADPPTPGHSAHPRPKGR